jgi:hypothetical protein
MSDRGDGGRVSLSAPRRFAVAVVAVMFALGATGIVVNLLSGSRTKRVAAAFMYFRPVLCTIPTLAPGASSGLALGPPTATEAACSASDRAQVPSTAPFDDTGTSTVILPYYDNWLRFVLGPADLDGTAVAGAGVVAPISGGGYQVEVTLNSSGAQQFNRIAAERFPYYEANTSDPPLESQEAVEVNGLVVAAPAIQSQEFNGTVLIAGSTAAPFTKSQAEALALHIAAARGQPVPPPGSPTG